MKFFPQVVAALALLPSALAVDRKLSVIVSFPNGTPESVVAEARQKIIDGGGQITHDYQIIKGFSAIAPRNRSNSWKLLGVITQLGWKKTRSLLRTAAEIIKSFAYAPVYDYSRALVMGTWL
ncbi:ase propeptide [Cordyceps militaris]|uniref:Ase propeptide n=1 Tax=Cordyceps militaris TaxID=73501 RepID=A0A2H4SVV7_CORMI|nr:ase propeptide [Cordyceps militaris]